MQPFVRALGDERTGLHTPWDGLEKLDVRLVPGTLAILLGAPGALKSILSLAWAYELMPEEPVLLISIDTDSKTQAARLVSLIEGGTVFWSEVLRDPLRWAARLSTLDLPLRVIDSPIAPSDLTEVIAACVEYWGRPPALVVVDDVSKLRMPERGYENFDTAMLELHRAARKHGTVVLAIHHLHRGDSSDRTKPIRLRDGKYTGEYEAEIVLGAWRPGVDSHDSQLRIGVLKNRFAEDDPNGGKYADLFVNPGKAIVRDPTPQEREKWRPIT